MKKEKEILTYEERIAYYQMLSMQVWQKEREKWNKVIEPIKKENPPPMPKPLPPSPKDRGNENDVNSFICKWCKGGIERGEEFAFAYYQVEENLRVGLVHEKCLEEWKREEERDANT